MIPLGTLKWQLWLHSSDSLRQIFYYRTLQVSGVSAASKLESNSEAWCLDSLGQELAVAEIHLFFLPLFLPFYYSFWFTVHCLHNPELLSRLQQMPLLEQALLKGSLCV